jgi:protein-S-isoprenylcysteine O-methyltransferase Ste14
MATLLWIAFLVGGAFIAWVSRGSLLHPRLHGFYRFFAWEILWGLFLLNVNGWFRDPFAWHQLISWILLIASLALGMLGFSLLRKLGASAGGRADPFLLPMERTTRLVTVGLYRYIRHPLYSSLLWLVWGMFFKSPSWLDAGLAVLCTAFLVATARAEERENLGYYGNEYAIYMMDTKMFIPFVF